MSVRKGVVVVQCGSGVAVGFDVVRAGEIAAKKAMDEFGEGQPDFACVFVRAPDADDVAGALVTAAATTGAASSIGCSAMHGVIGGGHGIEDVSAVSVFVLRDPELKVRAFHLEVIRTSDSIAVVGMPPIAAQDRLAMVLADAYSFPIEGFVDESYDLLPGLKLAGGLAVGPSGPGSTRLLLDGRVVERGAVGLVLGGEVGVDAFVSQGCRPVGNPMAVTKAEGNVLLELAGRPALSRLEDLLLILSPEDQAIASTGLQIGVARDEYSDEFTQGDFLVRNLIRVDPERRALVVADILTVGQTVQFQLRDAEAASDDLTQVLHRHRERAGLAEVAGALVFSCNGRGQGFFSDADHDAVKVRDELGVPDVTGYFATGEIGPVAGRNFLHGFSAAIVAFGPGCE